MARHAGGLEPVPASTRAWLAAESQRWVDDGLLDRATADALLGRYTADTGNRLARLVLGLGTAFVGVGVLWLVAANLEALSPLVRFSVAALAWLAAVVAAELVDRHRGLGDPSRAASVLRALGAVLWGAVVFQAAQSLQVPAYEPALLAAWSVGALALALATASVAPLVIGIGVGVGWYGWTVGAATGSAEVVAVALLVAGVLAAVTGRAAAAWRGGDTPWAALAPAWWQTGALLVLAGLFLEAVPEAGTSGAAPRVLVVGVVVAVAAALVALAGALRGRSGPAGDVRAGRLEVSVALLALVAGVALAVWREGVGPGGTASGTDVAQGLAGSLIFLVVTVGYLVVAELRGADRVPGPLIAALAAFVTLQSFALFSSLLSGAVLFLLLGAVLVGTGVLVRSGQRRIAAAVRP